MAIRHTDYKLLQGDTAMALEHKVNEHLNEGYMLWGGPMCFNTSASYAMYSQAVVKFTEQYLPEKKRTKQ